MSEDENSYIKDMKAPNFHIENIGNQWTNSIEKWKVNATLGSTIYYAFCDNKSKAKITSETEFKKWTGGDDIAIKHHGGL